MAAKGIRVDSSFNCAIRATSTTVSDGTPRRVPDCAMRGRRWLRVFNNGRKESGQRINVKVMIGNGDVVLIGSIERGFGLDIDEFVDLPFDDSIVVYAIAEPGKSADLRALELR